MISTHVLDTSQGHPAEGVVVLLEKKSGQTFSLLQQGVTNADGRFAFDCPHEPGTYRLVFQTDAYLSRSGITPFFTIVPVTFEIQDSRRKYHIPLLLNPYGYSTYRGS